MAAFYVDHMHLLRSSKFWATAGAVLVVTCLLLALMHDSISPTYQGRTVASWLVLLQSTNPPIRASAENAVREIGTNAVPTLTAWLSHRESSAERWLTLWLAKVGLGSYAPFSENYYRSKAMCGFRTLGPKAQCALPDLRKFLDDPALALNAAVALVYVAPSEAEHLAEKWTTDTNRLVKLRGLKLKAELSDR